MRASSLRSALVLPSTRSLNHQRARVWATAVRRALPLDPRIPFRARPVPLDTGLPSADPRLPGSYTSTTFVPRAISQASTFRQASGSRSCHPFRAAMGTSTYGSSLLDTASTTRAKSVGDDRSPASSSSVVIAGDGAGRTPLDLSANAALEANGRVPAGTPVADCNASGTPCRDHPYDRGSDEISATLRSPHGEHCAAGSRGDSRDWQRADVPIPVTPDLSSARR